MKITRVQIATLSIPLIRSFITAVRRTDCVQDVVVILYTDTGNIAYGSAASTPAITGETQESIISVLQYLIAPKLINKDISEFNNLINICMHAIKHNSSAKAAIDMALHDLFAQSCNLPLYKLLGGTTNKIKSCITISVKDINGMRSDAQEAIANGFSMLKIKVGLNPHEDIERIQAIDKILPDHVRLLIDANQGWSRKDAIKVINAIKDCAVEIIEQPVVDYDLNSLKYITDNTAAFIVADEACFSPRDVLNIVHNQSSNGINIKLMKCGGLKNAEVMYNIATTGGIRIVVGCMLESPIGVAAIASFAVSKPDILFADLDPLALIRENYVAGGARIIKDEIILSDDIGLGIKGFTDGITIIVEIK